MQGSKLRELALGELEKMIRDARDELLQMRLRKETGQVERSHMLKQVRKDIARMETILHEKNAVSVKQ